MDWIRSYVLTVTAAGILCAIVKALTENSGGRRMLHLTCGVFLTLAALSPLHSIEIAQWDGSLSSYRQEADSLRAEAEAMAQNQIDDSIRECVEAYIVDEGASLGAKLDVAVTIGENHMPEAVCISGDISPYIKSRLESILEGDLAIPKERQEWR